MTEPSKLDIALTALRDPARMNYLDRIYFLPWWMNTFWGRWLSECWPPAIALRSALTDAHKHLIAKDEAKWRSGKVLRSVGACIQSNFNEEFKRQLVEFYDEWRESEAEEKRAAMVLTRRR